MDTSTDSEIPAYENVLSVGFIYSLGVVAGKDADPHKIILDSINFFQQTPEDKKVGDLLASWQGRCFLIEFKRTKSHLSSELKKKKKLGLCDTLLQKMDMQGISLRGHFIGYGHYTPTEKHTLADLHFQRYASLVLDLPTNAIGVNDFITKMKNDPETGLNAKELDTYVEFLRAHAEDSTTASAAGGRNTTVSGVMTSISPNGKVVSFVYDSYEGLDRILNQKVSLNAFLAQQLAQEQSMKQQIRIESKKENKPQRGMGMSGR